MAPPLLYPYRVETIWGSVVHKYYKTTFNSPVWSWKVTIYNTKLFLNMPRPLYVLGPYVDNWYTFLIIDLCQLLAVYASSRLISSRSPTLAHGLVCHVVEVVLVGCFFYTILCVAYTYITVIDILVVMLLPVFWLLKYYSMCALVLCYSDINTT